MRASPDERIPADAAVVLDSNILLKDPGVLAATGGTFLFILPKGVERELAANMQRRPDLAQIADLVNAARTRGVLAPIAVISAPLPLGEVRTRLSGVDMEILETAAHLKETSSRPVFLATDDADLARAFHHFGGKTLTSAQLRASISATVPDAVLASQANAARRGLSAYLRRSALLGALVASGASLGLINGDFILRTLHIWASLLVFVLGPALFFLRSRFRLAYGTGECLFGVVASCRVMFPNLDVSRLDAVMLLQIVAGLYVMVRGMDNIGKGLVNTRFETGWKKMFRE